MSLTIVTYHYVRDDGPPPFSGLKARAIEEFDRQLDYIEQIFTVVSADDVLAALDGATLPDNAAWLTFDDGYIGHYTTAYPRLRKRGWRGSFFPCVMSSCLGRLLDVNKVQMIIASGMVDQTIAEIETACGDQFETLWNTYATPSRFDTADIRFVKMMLQTTISEPSRTELLNRLFRKFVSADEADIANRLYTNASQLEEMRSDGMYIGFHGSKHVRLSGLSNEDLKSEICCTLGFLSWIGADSKTWIACYPYGSHDEASEAALRSARCRCGLTVQNGIAQFGVDHPMRLPRVDTNYLPH